MFKIGVIIVTILSLATFGHAMRILVFFPLASKSHSILGHGVTNTLLEAGHEVVHVTGIPQETKVANLTEISLKRLGEEWQKELAKQDDFKLKNVIGKVNMGDSPLFLYFTYDMHKRVYEEGQVAELLSDPEQKFDAAILEWFFHESTAGIASVLQCPLIWFGSTEAHWQILRLVDEIPNPAYNVDIFSDQSPPLSFWGRTMELWAIFKRNAMLNLIVAPFEKMLYNSVFSPIAAKRGVPLASYEEAVYNASLLLVNSHPAIGSSKRLPQIAKNIAGYHVDSKLKPLPEDLKKLMDEAKHGVIYMSMGSNFKSIDMSTEMKESVLKTFAKLKQTVLWKFEGELDNVPSNVHLIKWAPQQSILAHHNLKVFITHGGQLSTTEAFHYGVPLIGMPVGADQHVNMNSVSRKGFCIKVDLTSENFGDDLSSAIEKMLKDPSYKIRARELSQIYHDRPVPPGKELVHWVEHVVRTRGAPHLRSPALLVPWYQKMYMDLAALIIAVFAVLIGAFRKFLPKKSVETVKSRKNEKKQKKN